MSETIYLSRENIQDFLMFLRKKKRKSSTIACYEAALEMLYSYLPPDKSMQEDSLSLWQQSMTEKGFSRNTIESRISTANRFMVFLGKPDWCAPHIVTSTHVPELTRGDYQGLLQAAKRETNRTAYLIIKVLCCTGMSFRQLSKVTVSCLDSENEEYPAFSVNPVKEICIPSFLRSELKDYAQEKHLTHGFLFSNKIGEGYSPEEYCDILRPIFRSAGVLESKLTSRAFQKLYHSVFDKFYYQFISQVNDQYTNFLLEEEDSVRWEEAKVLYAFS